MDNSSLSGTLKRYLQVGRTVGGLATRVAGQHYLDRSIDDEAYARSLKEALGNLKGPLMKVAQFLATIPDAIPPEYAQELLELQSQAPSMGAPFVRRRMTAELGIDWQTHFKEFNLQAAAAASLGQVHKAIDHHGNVLACKLQYPNMQGAIETDLNNLKMILGLYHMWNKALDTSEVQQEITTRLLEELDYEHEAEQIEVYQNIFKDNPAIQIPEIYKHLSTKRLLTMNWMDGYPLFQCIDKDECFRNQVADRLFEAWYKPFYHHGVIHGDPHPGNYLLTDEGYIQLLDFGCVRHFPPSFIQGVIDLYHALLHNKPEQAIAAYETWGFTNLSHELIEIMNEWARLLYDPLLDDKVRPIQKGFSGANGWETATKVHAELHRLGGIKPPKEFVFMDRAAVGLGSVFMRLKAERNWHQMFEELIKTRGEKGQIDSSS
jgi:predicted unusual protein kinase regulating ubiquinone biosynthesis (AarF/ABC1/UbiB family)